jgi:hypothetical protein
MFLLPWREVFYTLKMEEQRSSETLVTIYQIMQSHMAQDNKTDMAVRK